MSGSQTDYPEQEASSQYEECKDIYNSCMTFVPYHSFAVCTQLLDGVTPSNHSIVKQFLTCHKSDLLQYNYDPVGLGNKFQEYALNEKFTIPESRALSNQIEANLRLHKVLPFQEIIIRCL